MARRVTARGKVTTDGKHRHVDSSPDIEAVFPDPPVETVGSMARTISNKDYLIELSKLHVELVKLSEWIKREGRRVVILFEGRDAAGKGGAIKTHHLAPESDAMCASLRLARPPSARGRSGISSATWRSCPQPARWSCSTAAGTTAPASSA